MSKLSAAHVLTRWRQSHTRKAACICFLGLAVPAAMRLLGLHSSPRSNVALQRLKAQQVVPSRCWLLSE